MMKRILVRPASGRVLRQPRAPFARIPADGAEVVQSSYWLRRIKAGDAIELTEDEWRAVRQKRAAAAKAAADAAAKKAAEAAKADPKATEAKKG